jgi:hemoglobin
MQPDNASPNQKPNPASAFELMGGESHVRVLVDRFYDLMDLDAAYASLRAVHPSTLDASRDKLFWFLCGWMGGPNLYQDRFGHPRLRARHLPYAIDMDLRDAWLACMAQAMKQLQIENALQQRLMQAFYGTADWMRNQPT